LKLLTQYQVDNLTKYLDTNDDGFIMVDHFDVEMRNAQSMQVGAAAGSTMGRSLKSQESMTMGG
jgi:TnpA family transposase